MRNKKLAIDLDGLWANDNEHFTVRYKDIAPKQKQLLALKIKQNAQQYSIKKTSGPTPILIEEALEEINPIIFSEYLGSGDWYRGHMKFGVNAAVYTAGYRFQKLCQAVYLLTCRKKGLTVPQIKIIASLTHSDWEITDQYVNLQLNIHPDNEDEYEEERVSPIEDIGMEDIKRARVATEQRSGNRQRNDNYPTKRIDFGALSPRFEITVATAEPETDEYELPEDDNDENEEEETPTGGPGYYSQYYRDNHRPEPPVRIGLNGAFEASSLPMPSYDPPNPTIRPGGIIGRLMDLGQSSI